MSEPCAHAADCGRPVEISEDLEDLYENAPCGYLSLDPRGCIARINRTLCIWLGFSAGQLTGKRLQDIIPIASRIFYESHFAPRLRLQGFCNEIVLDFKRQDGTLLPALINAAERRGPDGNLLFTRLIILNTAERRRLEQNLIKSHAASVASLGDERASSALREQFIAVLGHDLRNPLGAISGGMHLLLRTPLNDKAVRLVTMVQDSVTRMGGLIENVMDFARGRLGGGLTLERTQDDAIETMLRHVVNELQTSAPRREINCHYALPGQVNADRRRIGQLLSNLLGNALTHGAPDQPVEIGAMSLDGWFELYVANAGEPIPVSALQTIFDPFARGSVRPSMQGLGLGLYIANQIATAHGGTLAVTSTAEQTRFTFRMPLEA